MSLADRIAEATAPKGKPCKYARVIAALRETDEDADEFDELVMSGRLRPSVAANALDAEDHFVAETVVRKHVAGACCCNR